MKLKTRKTCKPIKPIISIFLVLVVFLSIIPTYKEVNAAEKPSKPKISVVVQEDEASATITIKKTNNAEGYMIAVKYPEANEFSELATLDLSGKKKRRYKAENLPAGEYSIKIRAYLKSGEKTVWGKYSKIQTFTIEAPEEITEPATYEAGEIVLFGKCEQDNNLKNGTEPIEWIVYEVTDTDIYLISLRALTDGIISSKNKNTTITWENCDLRKWLNNDFYNESFSEAETAVIAESILSDTGTIDKIFLPSKDEMTRKDSIFAGKAKRRACAGTDYSILHDEDNYLWSCIIENEWGFKEHKTIDDRYACYWWLRTAEGENKFAMIDEAGESCSVKYWGPDIKSYHTDYDGEYEYVDNYGIRPALRINLLDTTSKILIKSGRFFAGKTYTSEIVQDSCVNIEDAKKGDLVQFGAYEQDNNLKNGSEAIVWFVLNKSDSEMTLLSKYGLDTVPYNTVNCSTTWENCSLRAWLNDDFYNAAFSDEEKELIKTTTVDKNGNSKHSINGGAKTKDKIYLLSMDDVINASYGFDQDYHWLDIKRRCGITPYALANGAGVGDEQTKDGISGGYWWLRSLGKSSDKTVIVQPRGYVLTDGRVNNSLEVMIRPVITITLK